MSSPGPSLAVDLAHGARLHRRACDGLGMDWIAVCDVSADDLTEFVQRLARQSATP